MFNRDVRGAYHIDLLLAPPSFLQLFCHVSKEQALLQYHAPLVSLEAPGPLLTVVAVVAVRHSLGIRHN